MLNPSTMRIKVVAAGAGHMCLAGLTPLAQGSLLTRRISWHNGLSPSFRQHAPS